MHRFSLSVQQPINFEHRQVLYSAPKQRMVMGCTWWKDELDCFASLWNKWNSAP